MSIISDNYQDNILKKNNINIKTKYIVGNNILQRNTDNSLNDNIDKGIRIEKNYIVNGVLKHTEKVFDSRIEYTYISSINSDTIHTCPNCGASGTLKDFVDGCPYCRTHYNIDYFDKELGNKYHYDRVLKSKKYRVVTAIVDLIISTIISFILIKTTSRTFNNFDVYKIFIYGLILSLVLYYVFYLLDAYVILLPIKIYKDKQNQKQIDFWNRTKIDKKKFFNNLNYELGKYYYSKSNIIDYDILDYISFNESCLGNNYYVDVVIDLRLVYYINGSIKSINKNEKIRLRRNNQDTIILGESNIITCPNCGSSVDVTKGYCEYCRKPIKSFQEWFIDNK